MDRCKQTQEWLADYRTGILDPRQVAAVEDHLGQCADCANELRVLDDVLALVESNTPDYEPPVGLWNGVVNRIASPVPGRPLFRRLGSRPMRVAGVGLAAVILAVGFFVSKGPRQAAQPVRVASNTQYIQAHALYAGQAPLADRVSYLSVVAASAESDKDSAK